MIIVSKYKAFLRIVCLIISERYGLSITSKVQGRFEFELGTSPVQLQQQEDQQQGKHCFLQMCFLTLVEKFGDLRSQIPISIEKLCI